VYNKQYSYRKMSSSYSVETANEERAQHTTVFGAPLHPGMPNLSTIFGYYAAAVKQLKDVSESDLAVLYGNYKQAHQGNNTSEQPWFYEFVALEKWRAWTACKDKPTEYAMFDYCVKAEQLLVQQHGVEKTKEILQSQTQP
jgi:acyl-CoA-binding protein